MHTKLWMHWVKRVKYDKELFFFTKNKERKNFEIYEQVHRNSNKQMIRVHCAVHSVLMVLPTFPTYPSSTMQLFLFLEKNGKTKNVSIHQIIHRAIVQRRLSSIDY